MGEYLRDFGGGEGKGREGKGREGKGREGKGKKERAGAPGPRMHGN